MTPVYLMFVSVGPAMDPQAGRDVQHIWLAQQGLRTSRGTGHCQHHGPAGENHDQARLQPTGQFCFITLVEIVFLLLEHSLTTGSHHLHLSGITSVFVPICCPSALVDFLRVFWVLPFLLFSCQFHVRRCWKKVFKEYGQANPFFSFWSEVKRGLSYSAPYFFVGDPVFPRSMACVLETSVCKDLSFACWGLGGAPHLKGIEQYRLHFCVEDAQFGNHRYGCFCPNRPHGLERSGSFFYAVCSLYSFSLLLSWVCVAMYEFMHVFGGRCFYVGGLWRTLLKGCFLQWNDAAWNRTEHMCFHLRGVFVFTFYLLSRLFLSVLSTY